LFKTIFKQFFFNRIDSVGYQSSTFVEIPLSDDVDLIANKLGEINNGHDPLLDEQGRLG